MEFCDRNSADQMLINDPLKCRWSTRVIPDTVRVDDSNGTILADAKAVRLGAVDLSVLREIEFGKAFLEIFP